MKYKINKCSYTDKKKDGTQIFSKFGKPTWRVGIQVPEYGEKWGNGFLPFAPDRWEGTEQEIEFYEEEYQGVKQLKFRLPSKEDKIGKQLEEINGRLVKINIGIQQILSHLQPKKEEVDYPPFQGEPNFDVGQAIIDTSEPPF